MNKKILLVDDEEGIRKILRIRLEKYNFDVIEAIHGNDALKVLDNVKVDLIITDIFMPEKDGIELIVEVKKRIPEQKIIAMSGGGQFNNIAPLDAAKILGVSGTIEKPFNIGDVMFNVYKVLGR